MDSLICYSLAMVLLLSVVNAQSSVKFGYSGHIGPMRWGSLCHDYQTCSNGMHQSPINIVTQEVQSDPNLHSLDRFYVASNATLVDNGFNIMVRYEGDVGCVFVEGRNYTLKQMHWHSPSEHTIDGKRFPVELHLVHVCDDGNTTVVSILFKYGNPDPFLGKLMGKVEEMVKEVHSGDVALPLPVGLLNAKAIGCKGNRYYRYMGSLTTPPCTENVIWTILAEVREISREQAKTLMEPLGKEYQHNSRPLQPLNGRKIRYYNYNHSSLRNPRNDS